MTIESWKSYRLGPNSKGLVYDWKRLISDYQFQVQDDRLLAAIMSSQNLIVMKDYVQFCILSTSFTTRTDVNGLVFP